MVGHKCTQKPWKRVGRLCVLQHLFAELSMLIPYASMTASHATCDHVAASPFEMLSMLPLVDDSSTPQQAMFAPRSVSASSHITFSPPTQPHHSKVLTDNDET